MDRIGLSERALTTGDTISGLVTWRTPGTAVDWRSGVQRATDAVAWVHVPSLQAGVTDADEGELADAVLDGALDVARVAPPFAAVRWRPRSVELRNDLFGLVRLFHFSMADGDVWSTRMGLAHVFMGERPHRNPQAWAGMATIGWAPGGSTQIGAGRHLRGGTHVRATAGDGGIRVDERAHFAEWLQGVRGVPVPPDESVVADMRTVMASALRWPEPPRADLSGGKDSRLIAAVGVSSGAVRTVRTVNSDHGEVETARRLVSASPFAVTHLVTEKRPVETTDDRWLTLVSQHAAWEGRYLASAAYGARPFTGFRPSARASFNGLGGEVLSGGALWTGGWRERMLEAPAARASERLKRLVGASPSTTRDAQELTVDLLSGVAEQAASAGITTAGGVLDLVYLRDRMPHWVNTFATGAVICPLFAPSLLPRGAHSVGAPIPDGSLHSRFIAAAVPSWAGIPFYKPTGHQRLSRRRAWEEPDWPVMRARLAEATEESADVTTALLDDVDRAIDEGTAGKVVETAAHRVLFSYAFDEYVHRLARESHRAAEAIAEARRVTPPRVG
ncbi:hypothetical protein J1G44_20250 [Cellulomonas sp. zg-ZUI199]|uniref:Asparagine synthetase domain-containing protein n=1 Tax=Cellulomonas wangleii TaxID=2816956 RepID=A0ABX8D6L3_9CELL|nr:hypothetical protein [Cellulomonas wangleii]MBO0924928.1 hypothetical protein [Cellulomonas wangleii]MBO0926810.1 hypothetical protein [Cellulomonas wangleii]QVI63088.1 hypothetical protein KG103_03990 [Cellulomonas wangleii]